MSFDEKEYQTLILAAWLHDIGKFYQRAGYSLDSDEDRFYESYYGRRIGEGKEVKYTHRHAIFSAKFIREKLGRYYEQAAILAALHHSPKEGPSERVKYLARLITLADWLASGERRERESEEDSAGFQAEPMISIFSRLKLKPGNQAEEISPHYISLSSLEADLTKLFPVKEKQAAFPEKTGQLSYKILWDKFIDEGKRLNLKNVLEEIPYLLEKFTLTIPATTVDRPDISLFHHSKSTAAIASCLYQLQLDDNFLDLIFGEINNLPEKPYDDIEKSQAIAEKSNQLSRKDFLLVGGDLSGIQNFIYSVTSEKALKGLRGRSFYLQLISEAVAKTILDEFKLLDANLLYSGGGNFFILLPKREDAKNRLNSLREKIDTILLKAHRGKLAVALSWIPVSYGDFFINFASLWNKVAIDQTISKKKKFVSLFSSEKLDSYWENIFGPFDMGGENPACSICGEEIIRKEKTPEEEKAEIEAEKICSLCHSFADLSGEISRAGAIRVRKIDPKPWPSSLAELKYSDVLLALGFDCQFLSREKLEEAEERNKYFQGYLRINSTDFAGRFSGYKFIANKITGPTGQTLTLEDMARAAKGIKKWGLIRADVDHLGMTFTKGLGKDKTISRLAMLSALLSLYFGARLNYLNLIEGGNSSEKTEKETYLEAINYVYVAYSGGDDLFLLGPWSVLPHLAQKIHKDFNQFSCFRLTLSAGIFIAPTEKFPIYQAAYEAGEAEHQAKKEGRDRIFFLNKAVDWTRFKEVKEIAMRLEKMLAGSSNSSLSQESSGSKGTGQLVPRAILSVLSHAFQEKELKEKREIPMERIWRLFYAFKRIKERIKKEKERVQDLEWLLSKSLKGYEIYPELNMAARWAEYLTRKEKQK